MKLLLIVSVLLLAVWLWRGKQRTNSARKPTAKPSAVPQDMISCTLCSLHIPSVDAVKGKKGLYCGPDHWRRAED